MFQIRPLLPAGSLQKFLPASCLAPLSSVLHRGGFASQILTDYLSIAFFLKALWCLSTASRIRSKFINLADNDICY